MSAATHPVPCTMAIAGELTIAHAAAHRLDLLATVAEASHPGGVLALDLSAVEAFDSAGVQLLMAVRKSVQSHGGLLHISATSAAVHDTLAIYGLQTWSQETAPSPAQPLAGATP